MAKPEGSGVGVEGIALEEEKEVDEVGRLMRISGERQWGQQCLSGRMLSELRW